MSSTTSLANTDTSRYFSPRVENYANVNGCACVLGEKPDWS